MTITADPKLEIARLTALQDRLVALKNCGVGSHGFEPGNTCARGPGGNGVEGGKRRRKAGKRRRARGPQTGVGPKSRANRRKKQGIHRQNQREWEIRSEKRNASPDHRELADSHLANRNDLADTLKAERSDLREQTHADRVELADTIRGERRDGESDRRRDRLAMKRRQAREVTSLEAAQARQMARLEAHHASRPARLAANRERLATGHREGLDDLRSTHGQERAELRQEQRDARSDEREGWRSQVEDLKNDDRSALVDQHLDHRTQVYEMHREQRRERLEFEREQRREAAGKAFEFIDVKASPDLDGVPRAHAILASVLEETGYASAWEANTLSAAEHTELLHLVRMEGRRYFRELAIRTLDAIDDLESKALFGPAKDKVGAFFRGAKKYVRELFVAGVLAFAGPAPMDAAEMRALDQEVAAQEKYLKTFEREIVEENKPLDGTFVSRAEQYGASVWGSAQEILRSGVAADHSYTHEMGVHQGEDEPCPVCVERESQGWQPIGKLRKIGDSPCRCNCHCVFIFGTAEDAARTKAFGLHEKRYVPCRDARGRFASCNGAPQGTRHPKPDGKPAPGPAGGKKPRKPKEPKPPKTPKPAKEPKPPKEPKKPAEKKPPKEKPAKPEKPAKEPKKPKEEAPKKPEAKPEPGKPPAAPGSGESWTVSPAAAKDWVKDSVFPATLYHRTYAPAKADIEANGINLAKTSGVYGQGLYASTKQEKSFGPETVEVALNIRKPLIASRDEIHRLQREWGPPGLPLHSSGFRDEVVRRGYDSVITHFEPTYQGPSGENWVVIMKPETARFVQR